MERKVQKKLKRKLAILKTQEPNLNVSFQDSPSVHVFIGNGGSANGISGEVILSVFGEATKAISMPPGKDYCFVTFSDMSASVDAVTKANGSCLQELCREKECRHMLSTVVWDGPPLHLYLTYVDGIPPPQECSRAELPPGLAILPNFITLAEETALLDFFSFDTEAGDAGSCAHTQQHCCTEQQSIEGISAGPHVSSPLNPAPGSTLRHRSVRHYGYEFLYDTSRVDPDAPLGAGVPDLCLPLLKRLVDEGLIPVLPDQLTVNQYQPGSGIPPHVDTHSAFEDGIVSVSLGSYTVMSFYHPCGNVTPVFLPQRSVLVMSGESRYHWKHGISSRKLDIVDPQMPGFHGDTSPAGLWSGGASGPAVLTRGVRVSLTFRKVRRSPCSCGYHQHCDSFHQQMTEANP